jgi:protein-disulfide isomerase
MNAFSMKAFFVLFAAVLTLAACSKAPQQAAAPDSEAFHQQVVAYLADRPAVIQEGITAYQTKQRAIVQVKAAKAIATRRGDLEHDPRDYVANPGGKITVVEFFDYRCPYCKAALPDLKALIDGNKDIRFVFKELPILPDADGQIGVSLRASQAAIAAGRAGKYQAVHDAMMAAKPLDDAGIVKALKDNGLNPAQLAAAGDSKHIEDVRALAQAIGATGTPTFVVGDTMVEGNAMGQLSTAIAQARKSAKG